MVLTIGEVIDFYKSQPEHWYIADDFVAAGFQQPKSGYIKAARIRSLAVDASLGEPNQKWHFLHWASRSKVTSDVSKPASVIWTSLKCPELLLWLAEAAGVPTQEVQDAKNVAIGIISSNKPRARSLAGFQIRICITWNCIETHIRNKLNS